MLAPATRRAADLERTSAGEVRVVNSPAAQAPRTSRTSRTFSQGDCCACAPAHDHSILVTGPAEVGEVGATTQIPSDTGTIRALTSTADAPRQGLRRTGPPGPINHDLRDLEVLP